MDCLDPPLTAMPVGKWMCPNHIEHMVVSKLKPVLTAFKFFMVTHIYVLKTC